MSLTHPGSVLNVYLFLMGQVWDDLLHHFIEIEMWCEIKSNPMAICKQNCGVFTVNGQFYGVFQMPSQYSYLCLKHSCWIQGWPLLNKTSPEM